MKSNVRASAIRTMSSGGVPRLRMLDRQSAQDVRDVLASVGHPLHRLVDPAPGDHLDRVVRRMEEIHRPLTEQRVRLVLEPVDLDDALPESPHGPAVAK